MTDSILPFSPAKSNEKLTDRGATAMVDEFAEAIGLPKRQSGFLRRRRNSGARFEPRN